MKIFDYASNKPLEREYIDEELPILLDNLIQKRGFSFEKYLSDENRVTVKNGNEKLIATITNYNDWKHLYKF